MKIYVSDEDKDFIDACLSETNCYLYIQDELQGGILKLKSLEQHDKELLREFADKLKDKIVNENTNEQGNLDYNVDLTGLLDDINELLKERGVE